MIVNRRDGLFGGPFYSIIVEIIPSFLCALVHFVLSTKLPFKGADDAGLGHEDTL